MPRTDWRARLRACGWKRAGKAERSDVGGYLGQLALAAPWQLGSRASSVRAGSGQVSAGEAGIDEVGGDQQ